MHGLPSIITDLAFILIIAALVTILFKWLRQPVVLGYIVAGFVTGPHFDIFPTIVDAVNVDIWAEIGVIFLLFGLGLEFSFKKLIEVGKTGFITLLVIIFGMGLSGFLIGQAFGWSIGNCLVLGCMLCLSSTTIIVKGFDDLGLKNTPLTNIVFGVLIFDDIFAILIMVLMGTLGANHSFQGSDMVYGLAKLIFFMITWIVCGIFVIPTFLKRVRKWLNDETLLVLSIGLCLVMVVFATAVGLSAELGAFIMGSVLAETIYLESIERVTKPIKDFFGAIFFVSVGMMMNPSVVVDNLWAVVVIALAVFIGKVLFTAIGVRISKHPLELSIESGFSMAQVGEFSFIVAGTAIAYGLADKFIYPIIIAVSIITTFATPYSMQVGKKVYSILMNTMPQEWVRKSLQRDENLIKKKTETQWQKLLKNYVIHLVVFITLALAVEILAFGFLGSFVTKYIPSIWGKMLSLLITLLALSPILKGIVHRGGEQPSLILNIKHSDSQHRWIIKLLIWTRYAIAFIFILVAAFHFLAQMKILAAIFSIIFAWWIFVSHRLLHFYWKLESRFAMNFNQRLLEERRQKRSSNGEPLAHNLDNTNWIESNIYVGCFHLESGSPYEGKLLKETDFRTSYNVIIAAVRRDETEVVFPNGDFQLQKDDVLLCVGSMVQFKLLVSKDNKLTVDTHTVMTIHEYAVRQDKMADSRIKCVSLILDIESGLNNKTLKDSDMGKRGRVFVVGMERNERVSINPHASVQFQANDILWLMGDKESIHNLVRENFHF